MQRQIISWPTNISSMKNYSSSSPPPTSSSSSILDFLADPFWSTRAARFEAPLMAEPSLIVSSLSKCRGEKVWIGKNFSQSNIDNSFEETVKKLFKIIIQILVFADLLITFFLTTNYCTQKDVGILVRFNSIYRFWFKQTSTLLCRFGYAYKMLMACTLNLLKSPWLRLQSFPGRWTSL